jgi:hypothetical protein
VPRGLEKRGELSNVFLLAGYLGLEHFNAFFLCFVDWVFTIYCDFELVDDVKFSFQIVDFTLKVLIVAGQLLYFREARVLLCKYIILLKKKGIMLLLNIQLLLRRTIQINTHNC